MVIRHDETTKKYMFGNPDSRNILILMVADYDLAVIEDEVEAIRDYSGTDFYLIALKVDHWNTELSPWNAPAVFGNEDFGNGGEVTLARILKEIVPVDTGRKYYLGGYSLSGLFALWCAYRTNVFSGVAAVSPSIWFPGFLEYMEEHEIQTDAVYLSLGDREERTRNPVMATVGKRIREANGLLCSKGVNCLLEWNKGNHFKDPELRTAKAFAWLLNNN